MRGAAFCAKGALKSPRHRPQRRAEEEECVEMKRRSIRSLLTWLILADEPTAALDRKLGQQVMELFAQIAHERRAGVLVVTHDHRTLEVFDRIFEMEDGQLRMQPISHQREQPA